jgi:hypothetical protein
VFVRWVSVSFKSIILIADGNPNEEDICGWALGTDDARRRQELLRAVRAGEYPIHFLPPLPFFFYYLTVFYSLVNYYIYIFPLFFSVCVSNEAHLYHESGCAVPCVGNLTEESPV